MYRLNRANALYLHAVNGKYYEAQCLLNEGVEPDELNSYEETPLQAAVRMSHRDVFDLLLHWGADINCRDKEGWTLLHRASVEKSLELIHRLVRSGALLEAKKSGGLTPLIMAVRWARREVVQLLIDCGADIHCCDDKGWTVLHYASDMGSMDMVLCLVDNGAGLDKKNLYGQTPLMIAVQESHSALVKLFISLGVDIQCRDGSKLTALHYASGEESLEIVQYLLYAGVDLEGKTCDGRTPLHYAVLFDRMDIADYLLKMGADCNWEDDEGDSPFHVVIRKRWHFETIKLCIEKGGYAKSVYYHNLLEKAISRDFELCAQAVINKFNNSDLPLISKWLATAQKLPYIDEMKIINGSRRALDVEQAVIHEIQAIGFCNLFEMVPPILSMLCVKSLLEYKNYYAL